jgi:hypothetical protein
MSTAREMAEEALGSLSARLQSARQAWEDVLRSGRLPRMMGKEALRAAMAWAMIYLLMTLCLLGYKWQAKGYYEEEYARRASSAAFAAVPLTNEPSNDVTVNGNANANGNVSVWSQHEQALQNVVTQLESMNEGHARTLSEVTGKRSTLYGINSKLDSLQIKFTTKPGMQPFTRGVQSLLQTQALSRVQDVEATFSKAVNELKTVIDHQSTVAWNLVDRDLMQRNYPHKVPSVATAKDCPAGAVPVPGIPSDAARKSDFDERMRKIDNILHRRTNSAPISSTLLPGTLMDVTRSTKEQIKELFGELIAVAQDSDASRPIVGGSCLVGEEEVVGLVEEGLLALLKHADLRNVLRKAVLELDPSAESIILDADLPVPPPRIPQRDSINLRRVLDTPLLFHTIDWIDQLVEMCGGYNDQLDQWLDSFADSVGEMAVSRLVEASGKVEIPHPRKLLEQLPNSVGKVFKNYKVL